MEKKSAALKEKKFGSGAQFGLIVLDKADKKTYDSEIDVSGYGRTTKGKEKRIRTGVKVPVRVHIGSMSKDASDIIHTQTNKNYLSFLMD